MHPSKSVISGDGDTDPGTPTGALAEFYRAFNGRDLALMRANWHPEECVLDNPLGGIRRGWDEIEPLYASVFEGAARVRVVFFDYTLHLGRDLFCAAGRERGQLKRDGLSLELAIRTSRLYRRLEGRWCQVHHHGSIEDPGLLQQYRSAVLA
ncbi:MAG TPA: nuclear transport factor 2 family protein [Gammaproteobacteria bacterium]|nr:nuclear transport factor 2 family protein [Gammaproteobacteria bacterium]